MKLKAETAGWLPRLLPAVVWLRDPQRAVRTQHMMALLAKHLLLFVTGKMQVEGLGDFCCASRPLRAE